MIRKINQKHYDEIKKKRLKIDKFKCTKCNSKINLIHHHKTYKNCPNEKIEDIITLCKRCHSTIHKKKIADWEFKRDAIIIKKYKRYAILLIDEYLFEKLGKPKKIDLFLFRNKIIIIKNNNGNLEMNKRYFRGIKFYFIEHKLLKTIKVDNIKYSSIDLNLKEKRVKFGIKSIY